MLARMTNGGQGNIDDDINPSYGEDRYLNREKEP